MLDSPEIKEVEVPLDEKGFTEFLNENAYCDQHATDVIGKKMDEDDNNNKNPIYKKLAFWSFVGVVLFLIYQLSRF